MLILVAILPFASTVLGGIAAFRLRHRLHPAMALAAGIMVATALVDLLPESVELIGTETAALMTGGAAVFGYLLYSAMESFVHRQSYEHGHPPTVDPRLPHEHEEAASPPSLIGWIAPLGLILHSLLDGLAIGLGFEAGTEVGIVVTLAVVVHDFADGLTIVTLALAGGRGRSGAIGLLVADAGAAVAGIAISGLVALSPEQLGLLLGGFAGAFLAIGAGHLLPEAEHREPGRATPLVGLAAVGAMVVVGVRLLIA